MRIVAGKFRGRPLLSPAGAGVRPTADRVRQTIFDILAHSYGDPVSDARVLDLFAGTGAFGFEALSRGAASVLFVEEDAEARGVIRGNVEAFGVGGATRIFRRDATKLGDAGNLGPFTLIFADPPYGKGLGERSLQAAVAGGWCGSDAVVVLEESVEAEIAPITGLAVLETRRIGDTAIHFLAAGPDRP